MIESTTPMSTGRLPMQIGPGAVTIVTDTVPYTNREVSFPYYPTIPKGYIKDGYGIDVYPYGNTFGGYINVTYIGYDERIDSGTYYYYVYRTPKFQVVVSQDDVINKVWDGCTFEFSAEQTTYFWTYTDPGPPVLVSTTPTPQVFTYTFSSADDPVLGGPDYSPVRSSIRTVLGTEYPYYLQDTISPTYPVSYTETITDPTLLDWKLVAITPP